MSRAAAVADTIGFGRAPDGARRLHARIVLPRPPGQVFPFFADAGNLERLTPAELGFAILTPRPIAMRAGTLIDYRLRLFGLPFRWQSEITVWSPPREFVDEQRRGPYALWRHRHLFAADPAGTLVIDEVDYRLPLGPAGGLAHPLVRAQLRRIFRFRAAALRAILAPETA